MSQPDYKEIRRRLTDRYNQRAGFFIHLMAFLLIVGGAWLLWLTTGQTSLGIPMLIGTIGWLVGIVAHGINYLMFEARERAIDRAIERERGWLQDGEKPKRDHLIRLTDEGELEEIVEEDEYGVGRKHAQG